MGSRRRNLRSPYLAGFFRLALIALFLGLTDRAIGAGPAPSPAATTPTASPHAAPASQPANHRPDESALQADAILKAFPGNATSLRYRTDASHFTLEGMVREIDPVTLPDGSRETHIILVGKQQAPDSRAHFTCHLDAKSQRQIGDLKPDQVIRVTGSIGATSAAAYRIDLMACHDIQLLGKPDIADSIIGRWRAGPLVIDNHDSQGPHLSGLYIDVDFKADHTLEMVLHSPVEVLHTAEGKWSIAKAKAMEHLAISLEGKPAVEEPLSALANGNLEFTLPPVGTLVHPSDITCEPIQGKDARIDSAATRRKGIAWIAANNRIPQQQQAEFQQNVADFLDGINDDDGYTIVLGSDLARNGKTNAIVGYLGQFYVFTFSDAQSARNAATKNSLYTVAMKNHLDGVRVPEVKIDSVSINDKDHLDFSKPIIGKITLHALGRVNDGGYQAIMACENVTSYSKLDKPAADEQTFDVTFHASAGRQGDHPNPRVALFFVTRTDGLETKSISDPVAMLLDPQN